ncbi:PEGA domain-containing protein [Candidatus Berkelbacteria bacterium]|nr:PEGA domain-containing protein [Candidatus Berkelbacteria bacterium]
MTRNLWIWILLIALPLIVAAIAFVTFDRFGTLVVLPQPATAAIVIDGKPAKITNKLAPGNHEVVVAALGYSPYREQVTIKLLRIDRLNPTLKPIGAAKLVVSETVDFLQADRQSNQFFYFNKGAKAIFRLRLIANKIENIPITPSVIDGLQEIAFPADFSVAAIRKTNGLAGLYNFARYDLLHQEFKEFDHDSSSFAFDPNSTLLYQIYHPGQEQSLARSERSRDNFERIFHLNDAGIGDATLEFSPNGEVILLVGGNKAYLFHVTTKTLTPIGDQVSSARFVDNQTLVMTKNNQLVMQPFTIVKTATTQPSELGKATLGAAQSLGLRGEANNLAISPDRLIGMFSDPKNGEQVFGSYELKFHKLIQTT